MSQNRYQKAVGIFYPGALSKIRKSDNPLQPIFEAFTNSLESIRLLKHRHSILDKQSITISLHFEKSLFDDNVTFQKIQIYDTGIGFDKIEYDRLIALNNNEKGFSNKGTGRVQFLHTFNKTYIFSDYRDESSSTKFRKRALTMSKSRAYLNHNAIIKLEEEDGEEASSAFSSSTVAFEEVLTEKDRMFFQSLTSKDLKESVLNHYLGHFCENREDLPHIFIKTIVGEKIEEDLSIEHGDIPIPDKEKDIEVSYSTLTGNKIETLPEKETFKLKSFKLPQEQLQKNELILVSKGELASNIKLENLLPYDQIAGYRYLFLLSGKYIDNRDSDTRGKIIIPKKSEFKKDNMGMFEEKNILIEDIEDVSNSVVIGLYNEIKAINEAKKQNLKELQQMFLLNPKILDALSKKISVNDSDDVILKKVYEAEAKIVAEGDAELKKQVQNFLTLDTSKPEYKDKLKDQVDELVKSIPLQNRTALTHYVARRKLVLELFNNIIKKELEIQSGETRNIDEKLLHNLIFQQTNDNPTNSDLWLLNEEYIYFKGTSEGQLGKILIDGENILKETLTHEEEIYKLKQQGDASQRRPDILLFPKEGKCIIIEFKSLDTNISAHLNQINRYASIINNLSKTDYKFHTYYGYLIGENIDLDDIEDNDSDFKSAHKLNFIFRPHKRILGKFGNSDSSLYTEVIKYSVLLERAITRNRIFIEKLTSPISLK